MPEPRMFCVIANCEDEYAVWPADVAVPAPWRQIGIVASLQECASFVSCVEHITSGRVLRHIVEQPMRYP
jgi:uncharacterized protein YbdZ (MbtH family)